MLTTTTEHVVVIASASAVSNWRVHFEAQPHTLIFSEADFVVALETILSERPNVVALDPAFAATARGAALVARIKGEPLLNGCEVTTLVGENGEQPFVATSTEGLDGKSAVLWQPLDTCGTRRSQRFEIQSDVDAKVNGILGRLVNLSVSGSQLLAPIRVRPAEGIRVTLTDEISDLRLAGIIAWVNLEVAARSVSQRYRFGVEFRGADPKILENFCLRHKQD